MLDDLNELIPDVPKVRTVGERGTADPAVVFGLDAQLWRASTASTAASAASAAAAAAASSASSSAEHMAFDSECHHVLPAAVPPGWLATRASLQAMLTVAPTDDLYRTKGVVPLSAAEAAAELERCGRPDEAAAWWLFNGVAGRLTLEPLPRCAGPTSLVFMGRDLARRTKAIAAALGLPADAVTNAKITLDISMGNQRRDTGEGSGVARGLCLACDE